MVEIMRRPRIIRETARGLETMSLEDDFFQKREIFLTTGIEAEVSTELIKQLLYLNSMDPMKEITLYINSPGGSVTAGFAIYDTMKYIQCDVATICVGLAASFGAFLLAGGTQGKRMALPNAEIMIHQPAIHGNGIQGPASDIKIMSDYMQKNKQRLNRILAENTGRSIEEIERDTDRDHFMSAEEALKYGLIDSVISKRQKKQHL